MKKGDLQSALASVSIAEKLNPNYASAQLAKAEIMMEMGASEEQVKSFVEKARKIYEGTGLRSDGTPLRAGDLEGFFSRFK